MSEQPWEEKEYACDGCGDELIENVVRNMSANDGTFVCRMCGLCYFDKPIYNAGSDLHDFRDPLCDNLAGTTRPQRISKNSYNRKAHLFERFSMDRCQEPTVPDEHNKIFAVAFSAYLSANPSIQNPGKADIRAVLRGLERQSPGTQWTKLYLEKWKSLLRTCNIKINKGLDDDAVVKNGLLFLKFSRIWDNWQKGKKPAERRHSGRSHFPNFNFAFRVCFALTNTSFFPDDWHIPQTVSCIWNMIIYMVDLATEANLVLATEENMKKIFRGTGHSIWDMQSTSEQKREWATTLEQKMKQFQRKIYFKFDSSNLLQINE